MPLCSQKHCAPIHTPGFVTNYNFLCLVAAYAVTYVLAVADLVVYFEFMPNVWPILPSLAVGGLCMVGKLILVPVSVASRARSLSSNSSYCCNVVGQCAAILFPSAAAA